MRAAPGDPAIAMLGQYASESALKALRERMGLNDPLLLQYFRYVGDLIRGDLGRSLHSGIPVARQLVHALPYTLQLTFSGILIAVCLGLPLGIFTALRRNSAVDYFGRVFSLAGLSIPSFYLGILLMLGFSVKLDFFPVMGGGELFDFRDNLHHLILPALSLGIVMTAYVTRMTRTSLLEILMEDYVTTARSKGLHERTVVWKHTLRNALIPIAAVIGAYASITIGSSVMVEIVFSRPGLGKMLVGAANQRDYPTVQSLLGIIAFFVVGINLITDILYAWIDPRIRLD
jgi:ABC-type dipeptide/oligopeptide/nickel transport system permease component